jgi:two-component system chemotaxis response regulator CheY
MSSNYANLHVLIVDADKFTRDLIASVLEELGLSKSNIFCDGEAEDALETLRIRKVDIVICDRNMGSIDGVEFVRKIRDPDESPARGVPVIFCSRQLNRELVAEIRNAGVNEAIVKPITIGAIESRIRSVLQKPRRLISVTDYYGPDRRRVDSENVPRERRAQPRENPGRSSQSD